MQKRHPVKKGKKPDVHVRRSTPPHSDSQSDMMEDSSLRAAFQFFANTANGASKGIKNKDGKKEISSNSKDSKNADSNNQQNLQEPLLSTTGKLLEKLTQNQVLSLAQVNTIVNYLQSPLVSAPYTEESNNSPDQIMDEADSTKSLYVINDAISLAYIASLNAEIRFANSENISEKTSLTRLKAALLDTVKGALEYLSKKMEPSDLDQQKNTPQTEANLQIYARVISTFGVTANDEESKDDLSKKQQLKEAVKAYEQSPEQMVSQVIQNRDRILSDVRTEKYLTDSLAQYETQNLAAKDKTEDDVVMNSSAGDNNSSNTFEADHIATNLDDLDAVLNFQNSEFSKIVDTMSQIITSTDKQIDKNTMQQQEQEQPKNDVSDKDYRLTEEFLETSRRAVIESLVRYVKAVIMPGNGLNCSATVSQLHRLGSIEGATKIGPLLKCYQDVSKSAATELIDTVMTVVNEQIDQNLSSLSQIGAGCSNNNSDIDNGVENNERLNSITEAEFAFVRLGSIASLLGSMNNSDEQHQQTSMIDKAANYNLANLIDALFNNGVCPLERQESYVDSVCLLLRPLQKILTETASKQDHQRQPLDKEASNSTDLFRFTLGLSASLQSLSTAAHIQNQRKLLPSINMIKSTDAAAKPGRKTLALTNPDRKKEKRKSRDDFKKFLHAKRQATQVTIIQSPSSHNMVEPQIVIDVVERKEKKQEEEEEKLDSAKEEEKEVDKESDGEKDAMQADDRDDADSKANQQQQPLIERLIILAPPDFDMTVQAQDLLLVFLAKQITTKQDKTGEKRLGVQQMAEESFDKLLCLAQKVGDSRSLIYEGILQLFCRSDLAFTPELKAIIETKLCSMPVSTYEESRVMTAFTCKLIMKLGFSPDAISKLVQSLLRYVFEKGSVKTALDGSLYQGMQLNIYMLILTCVGIPNSSQWRQEICMNLLNDKIKTLLVSELAKKNAIVTSLQQVWHLMALLMLDEDVSKLQKKAIFTFLTKKDLSLTMEKLLSNPFIWKVNQAYGQLSVVFSADQLHAFIQNILEIRNTFFFTGVEEPLEIPCQIIAAQLSLKIIKESKDIALEDGIENDVDASKTQVSSLLATIVDFHQLFEDSLSNTQEELEQAIQVTEDRLEKKLTEALQCISEQSNAELTEPELELLRLCLIGDINKPLFDLASLSNHYLATAFKQVLKREALPFPLPLRLPSSAAAGQESQVTAKPISGLHVFQHLFSQIKTLAQSGSPEITLFDHFMLQSFYSLQTLWFAQQHILKTKFKVSETIDNRRIRVNNRSLTIIEKSITLLQSFGEAQNEAKAENLRKDILSKMAQSSQFANLEMSQYLGTLLANSDVEAIGRLIRVCLSKELIWAKSSNNAHEQPKEKKGGVGLQFDFGSKKSKEGAKQSNSEEEAQNGDDNLFLKKIFGAFATETKHQDTETRAKYVQTLWTVLSQLTESIAAYFEEALERSNLTSDFATFLEACLSDLPQIEALSECIYEAIETTCGIRTSIQGFLSTKFVLNSMSLANVIKTLVKNPEAKSEQRFIQFIKDVLLQQVFESEDAKLLVLDTLCMLCQDLQSQIDQGGLSKDEESKEKCSNYEAMVVYCRKQYLEFKEDAEARRKKEELEHEEEMKQHEDINYAGLSISKKSAKNDSSNRSLLEGYKQDVFNNSETDYARYMSRPEEKCTFIRTGKEYQEQHWYYCYTCGLTGNSGVCAICVRTCHKGHHVIYSRKSTFFCDCALEVGPACVWQETISEQEHDKKKPSGAPGGLFGQMPPPGSFPPPGNFPAGSSIFQMDVVDDIHPNAFGGIRPPDFLSSSLVHEEQRLGSLLGRGFGPGGPPSRMARQEERVDPRSLRPSSRLSRVKAGADHGPSSQPGLFGGVPSQSRQMRASDFMAPSFSAFGQRPPPASRAFERSLGSGPNRSSAAAQRHQAKPPDVSGAEYFAKLMRRFKDGVSGAEAGKNIDIDASENNSNADGSENPDEAMIDREREHELDRIIEQSILGRAGAGALFSDSNFLGGSMRLGLDSRPVQVEASGDSGVDEEIEDLDESNLHAIERELLDAGYSQSEVRETLRSRILEKRQVQNKADKQSSSEQQSEQSSILGSRDGMDLELEMSHVSSLSQESWGKVSVAESLHSAQFRRNLPIMQIERQSQRFAALKTVLVDQQELVEGILGQVYDHLDNFEKVGGSTSEQMEVDSGTVPIKKQSSSTSISQILEGSKTINFKSEFASQKHAHKESTFRCIASDRATKNYISENMQRRQCISSTEQGLVCVLEDEKAYFYGANALLDPQIASGATEKNSLFKYQPKRHPNALPHVDTFKPAFVPVSAKFNSAYESYCAIWGKNDLHVLTVCPREGKVKSDLTVNLMLAAFGEQLTILNVEWVPGARTIIGVGTQIFVRIYDLSKDNFSPIFNVQLPQGSINDFAFTRPLNANYSETGRIQTRIMVASQGSCQQNCSDCQPGEIYCQELNLVNETDSREASNSSSSMQVDEKMQNNEIFLTHKIEIREQKLSSTKPVDRIYKVSNEKGCIPAITAMSYLPTHQMLALTFKSGQSLIGRLNMRTFNEISGCLVIPSMASLSQKQAGAKALLANGDSFYGFAEIPHLMAEKPSCLFLSASYAKQGASVPCILEINSNDKIQIEMIKGKNANTINKLPTVHGYAFVKPSFKKTWRKAPRFISVDESGVAFIYKIDDQGGEDSRKMNHGSLQELNNQRKIQKADLPKKVTLPANFFEKQRNIWSDQNIYKSLVVTGSFSQLMKSKIHRIFDNKQAESAGYADDREKETKLILALNARKTENVIVGVRIRIGGSQRQSQIKIKVFDREPITVSQGDSFWYDIGFSDVETIFGSQNQVEIAFTTTNVKSCPVRIHKIELYVATITEFQLNDKLGKHLKELYKQIEAKKASKSQANAGAAIKRELLQTNHLPYLQWQEKYKSGDGVRPEQSQLEIKLSILQQFLLSNTPKVAEVVSNELRETLTKLQQKLTTAFKVIIEQSMKDLAEVQSNTEYASIKRTFKIVLTILKRDSKLGDSLNFKTIKDRLIYDTIKHLYVDDVAALPSKIELIRFHLKALGNIRQKRSQQYFKLIEADKSDLVAKITQAYLQAIQGNETTEKSSTQETSNLVNLILADYQLNVNAKYSAGKSSKGGNLKALIGEIIADTSLAEKLEPLARLLMTKNDRVAKQIVKSIQRCLYQYQTMMARTFMSNQIVRFKYFNEQTQSLEDNEVVMIDVIPHLLHHLLLITIPKHRERAQLPFKVSLGIIGAYMKHSTEMGLPSEYLFPVIKQFIRGILCETQITEPSYQFIYAILTLLNTLFVQNQTNFVTIAEGSANRGVHHPSSIFGQMQDAVKKQPDDNLESNNNSSYLRSLQREQLVAFISEGEDGKELTDRLITWISSALEQLNAAYQAGRCTLRVQMENQVKVGAQDHLGENQLGAGVNLLRPVLNQQASWRWTPLLPDSDEVFELLDRKIPAAILILCQSMAVDLPKSDSQHPSFKKLLRAIAQLSHTLPSSHIFSKLGQTTLVALVPDQAKTFMNQTLLKEFISDLKQICITQLKMDVQQVGNSTTDATTVSQGKTGQSGTKNEEMSYNMQFQFQKMLQNGVKLAFETPNDWRDLIDSTGSRGEILTLLIRLLDYVGDQSAFLCLTLAALTAESSSRSAGSKHDLAKHLMQLGQQGHADGQSLFQLIQAILQEEFETDKQEDKEQADDINNTQQQSTHLIQSIDLDFNRIVDVFLLGKSNRMIRIATARLLKSLYDSQSLSICKILPIFMGKFATLSATGVNSSEFLSIFGYFCSKELARVEKSGITQEQVSQIVTFISSQIQTCNRQLTSHPNLDLYATIQKVCNQQANLASQSKAPSNLHGYPSMGNNPASEFGFPSLGEKDKPDGGLGTAFKPMGARKDSQQQQYILELDPCSKCFQTSSPPYRSSTLKDLQSDQKFTDSTSIYRLKAAYQLKSFSYSAHEARGYKALTKITLYVNSVQDVDLAEMKNNWAIWSKVCDLSIDLTQKSTFTTILPLPVTATNILIEYHSVNLSKPVDFNRKANRYGANYNSYGSKQGDAPGREAKSGEPEAEGLDHILQQLPKDVSAKLTLSHVRAQSQQAENGVGDDVSQNVSMTCPRCGSHVNNSHGNCNNCGENAMQCPACRNINYEKIDPYQCKECGISRYCKGDLSLNLREGVAIQTIDSEDMKKNAEEQVEKSMQAAQTSYLALMKHRSMIQTLACQINEGSEVASPQQLQQLYSGECLSQYQTMMKSLSMIKSLRIEIGKFQKTAQSIPTQKDSSASQESRNTLPLNNHGTEKVQQSCFGCIHAYLQALLNFIVLTSDKSDRICQQFALKEQAKQLYYESLRMFSQSIQRPARFAICALIKDDEAQSCALLNQIENDLHNRSNFVPSHLLLQNLHQEAKLLIDLFAINKSQQSDIGQQNQSAVASFWRVLFQSLQDAQTSSAVAEAVTAPILRRIERTIHSELHESTKKQLELQKAQLEQTMQVDEHADQKSVEPSSMLINTNAVASLAGSTNNINKSHLDIKGESAMLNLLKDYLTAERQDEFTFVKDDKSTCCKSRNGQWLVQSLLLNSSQSARQFALAIFKRLLSTSSDSSAGNLKLKITEMLIQCLDDSLQNSPLASEEYFNLLTQLLLSATTNESEHEKLRIGAHPPTELLFGSHGAPPKISPKGLVKPFEENQKKRKAQHASQGTNATFEVTEDTKRHFRQVLDRIDGELVKLFALEQEKKALGLDGFMPQLSAGQSLCRLVKVIALMMNDQPALTAIVQQNVRVVLKTLLKLKKLTLVKNKQIKNCEDQINGIFSSLHSDSDSDKSNFIKECLSLIQSGDCDLQESRYLFEDICKMIVPAKPELEYFLHLQKARSNEEFIPGKMSKNPYSSKSFGGKTMGDVRLKICRDCDIGEPEMLELLVANKIVEMNLPINAVYEQVWWPAQYKAKHPDTYEVPSIEQGMKEDPSLINSMVVIFRLAGMDGEATEDRVENLQTDQEPSSEKELEKKYGLAAVIGQKLLSDQEGENSSSREVSGVSVLLKTLSAIVHVQDDKDLASWLVQLMNITIKLRKNRLEFLRHPKAVAIIAQKLFQSVGMHSKFDGKNEQSLFDIILNILEVLINEQINASSLQANEVQESHQMQIDTSDQPSQHQQADKESEAVTHVQIFLTLILDACKEMIEQMKPLDQASKKIKAVSKVLPQLINKNDKEALAILISLVQEHLTIDKIHLIMPESQNASVSGDTFTSKFYIERIVDIVESIPVHKNFIKDAISETQQFNDLLNYMINDSAQFKKPDVDKPDDLPQNTMMLRILKAIIKSHPKSQQMLSRFSLVEKLYTLSLQKFKPMKLVLLAEDCVKLLTNELADGEVRASLQQIIDKKKKEQLLRARKAKTAAKMRLQKKGAAANFLTKMQNMEEEKGPKCVTCEEGYTAKPGDILGMYVFSKRLSFKDWNGKRGGSQTQGYTTVTHSNFIHYQCHQEAARIEREKQPPIREWEGAKTRNHLTLCNNLFPVFGGNIERGAYPSVIDKYFATQSKQVGAADSNRVKVLNHDLKNLLKRFACNESFSRDSKGGGPEHNMQFVAFYAAIINSQLQNNSQQNLAAAGQDNYVYVQEQQLAQFLEQSTQKRQDNHARLAEAEGEEEKQMEQSEEEDKCMEEEGEEESQSMMSMSDDLSSQRNIAAQLMYPGQEEDEARADQVYFFMSLALLFARMQNWEQMKLDLISSALLAISVKPHGAASQTDQQLRMMEESNEAAQQEQIVAAHGRSRARSLSNASIGLEKLPEVLASLRPFLVMLSLIDLIKSTWDGKVQDLASQNTQEYHDLLLREYLNKGNLMQVIEDSNLFYKVYNEKVTKLESVESFLTTLKLKDRIVADYVTIEKFVIQHF